MKIELEIEKDVDGTFSGWAKHDDTSYLVDGASSIGDVKKRIADMLQRVANLNPGSYEFEITVKVARTNRGVLVRAAVRIEDAWDSFLYRLRIKMGV